MGGYLKTICFLLFLVVATAMTHTALSQEMAEEVVLKKVEGQILTVDLQQSLLAVKYLQDEENQVFEDITVYIGDSTIVDSEHNTLHPDDLKEGNEITVEYTTDAEGRNRASYISIE